MFGFELGDCDTCAHMRTSGLPWVNNVTIIPCLMKPIWRKCKRRLECDGIDCAVATTHVAVVRLFSVFSFK